MFHNAQPDMRSMLATEFNNYQLPPLFDNRDTLLHKDPTEGNSDMFVDDFVIGSK